MKEKIDRANVELYFEDNVPFLRVTYKIESERDIRLVVIPKIMIPFPEHKIPNLDSRTVEYESTGCVSLYQPNVSGNGMTLNLLKGSVDGLGGKYYVIEQVIETKTHEMTLDEIEEKLGYKVKIVNKG